MSPLQSQRGRLESALGVEFRDPRLLEQALTHRSYLHEHPEAEQGTNERLEFLGDAVLHFVVAELLYARFPDLPEGRLTPLRAAVVRTESLARVAEQLDLASYLLVSRGEATIDGRGRQSILANCFEAVVAAVFLDAGLDVARSLLHRLLDGLVAQAAAGNAVPNLKGRLQELVQARRGVTPSYRVVNRSGPVHAEEFVVEAVAGDEVLGRGRGIGKRLAETDAARDALEQIGAAE